MPITLNGSGTVSGISAGGLPDGIIQSADLATGVNLGKILQYKVTNKTDQSSINTTTPAAIPNFSVTITPTASNSTMIVRASCFYSINGNVVCSRIYNGTSFLIQPNSFPSPDHQSGSSSCYTTTAYMMQQNIIAYETSSNTTARTYSPFWRTGGGTLYLNRFSNGDYQGVSTMTVMEETA